MRQCNKFVQNVSYISCTYCSERNCNVGIRQLAEFANPKSHNATKIEILFVCRQAVLQNVTVKLYYNIAYYSMIIPYVFKTIFLFYLRVVL